MRIEMKINDMEIKLKSLQCLESGTPRNRGKGWTVTVKRTDIPCVFYSFLNYKGSKICSYSSFCNEVYLYPQNFVGISKKKIIKQLRFIAPISSNQIDYLIESKRKKVEWTLPEFKFR